MRNSNRVALITGPTSGIGKTFAYKLASEGYDLILVARRQDKLEGLIQFLKVRYQSDIQGIVADLSKDSDIVRIAGFISNLQRLDLLVNNAGFGAGGYFIELPLKPQISMLNVHLNSTIQFCHAAIPVMVSQSHKGYIINIASFSAFIDLPGSLMYTTTKSAVVHFSKMLQNEVKNHAIKVQALCPSFTPTAFHNSINGNKEYIDNLPDFFWTSREQVVNCSLQALNSNRLVCVPGKINQFVYWLCRLPVSSTVLQKIALKLINRNYIPRPFKRKRELSKKESIASIVNSL